MVEMHAVVLDGVWRCHLLSSLCSSPFGCRVMCGELWPEVEIPAVAGALEVFYHLPSDSGSADQQGAQSPVRHREQTGNTGLGRSFHVFSTVRGNIETETAGPSGYFLFAHS